MDILQLRKIADKFKELTGLTVSVCSRDGLIAQGSHCCPCPSDNELCASERQRAIEETARWGEPYLHICPIGNLIFGIPLMINSQITGGLIVDGITIDEDGCPNTEINIRECSLRLLKLVEDANLTNSAYLELRRAESARESRRAEAIHELKGQGYDSIREIYLKEEAGLMSAIKRGDKTTAREIINRILVGIYFFGNRRPDLLKSFILELVVMMSRSAVEAGGDPSELLGVNYSSVTDLAAITSEEDLTAWLVSMLERIIDAIGRHREYPTTVLLNTAFAYAEEHLSEPISRDQMASIACLSPSHFSRVVKEKFGRSFTEILTGMRIDRARELLTCSEMSIIQISEMCGFSDQSYFTKVFQKTSGCTPGEYRQRTRNSLR